MLLRAPIPTFPRVREGERCGGVRASSASRTRGTMGGRDGELGPRLREDDVVLSLRSPTGRRWPVEAPIPTFPRARGKENGVAGRLLRRPRVREEPSVVAVVSWVLACARMTLFCRCVLRPGEGGLSSAPIPTFPRARGKENGEAGCLLRRPRVREGPWVVAAVSYVLACARMTLFFLLNVLSGHRSARRRHSSRGIASALLHA